MLKYCIVFSCAVALCCVGVAALAKVPSTLTAEEELGKELFFDKLSEPGSMSCADCHAPSVGFTGPIAGINAHGAVYRGAVPQRFGNRKPPSAAYATLSPVLHFDAGEGLFVGGNFWDGRATGERLGNPAADQALGPFLNPVEQNNPSKQAVLEKVAASKYAGLWEEVWGEPISTDTPGDILQNYDRIGLAIAAYENSSEVNPFSSKFDMFMANADDASLDVMAIDMSNWQDYADLGLSMAELEGFALYNDESKGACSLCHPPPLFTDFTYDNLGVPKNMENPFYDMDEVLLGDGTPINPAGDAWIDPGLGGFLMTRAEWQHMAADNWGKHKVPTVRNVGKASGENLPKAYMHNGVFKSLKEVVHFYNTRDVETWPPAEVAANVNTDELGDLGLTGAEEDLIVLFMETLSDGYKPKPMGHFNRRLIEHSLLKNNLTLDVSPNPFNPSTVIRYYLPTAGDVRVRVFNVAGQKLVTLVDGHKNAGDHRIDFAGGDLPSGVYFIQVTSGGEGMIRKVVLLK
jgi:cytochrome c peroxidase